MLITEAIRDANLFRSFLANKDDSLDTWLPWMQILRALYGIPIQPKHHDFIKEVTGRDAELLPEQGFDTALFLTGRRSGKSRIAAVIAAFEATLTDHESKLAPGERGIIPIISVSKNQAKIVRDYLRAIFNIPMLQPLLSSETKEGFELKSGVRISIVAGDFRLVRGFTMLAAIIDEICFFGVDADAKIKSDTELVRAIKPSLITTGGKMVCISSPYARKGWSYKTYERNFGNDKGRVFVVNCGSMVLNATLPQDVIDDAMAEDLASARSEFYGEWRDDVAAFIPREIVEALVVKGRKQLLFDTKYQYQAFVDVSGGRADDATLAIAHREDRKVLIDALFVYRPPFNPHVVIRQMAEEVKRYNVRKVVGDNYAAEFVAQAFQSCGIRYRKAEKNKSELYLELLPRLCSSEISLLDNDRLVDQIAGLERRTRVGGRDSVDHPTGGHDDLANAVAGVSDCITAKRRILGAF